MIADSTAAPRLHKMSARHPRTSRVFPPCVPSRARDSGESCDTGYASPASVSPICSPRSTFRCPPPSTRTPASLSRVRIIRAAARPPSNVGGTAAASRRNSAGHGRGRTASSRPPTRKSRSKSRPRNPRRGAGTPSSCATARNRRPSWLRRVAAAHRRSAPPAAGRLPIGPRSSRPPRTAVCSGVRCFPPGSARARRPYGSASAPSCLFPCLPRGVPIGSLPRLWR